jgi:hypothetical protein
MLELQKKNESRENGMSLQTQKEIAVVCDSIKEMLIDKNKSYGDSALDPVRMFSRAEPAEQLAIRIDDKLSRVQRGHEYPGDDTIDDLIGYLVLFKIARSRANAKS